ncbi:MULTISPECIES: hypothetical protein [Burkholderia]|uniref:LysR family transcriptional regulator n=1 Tax=Burkholderia humptydooensis MSMB43 TaxID=441157 RepID=A0ABN0FWV3_9BURK|nr:MULTISPECIES: hypothetical protein [Burkholderia]AJY40419.1 hypothetical protein BW21_5014 [Burkholderia sp. 2002721687]EIP84454.1 hypothetical protein A33K_18897 [Burkholderia humptydooensis MSMB43]
MSCCAPAGFDLHALYPAARPVPAKTRMMLSMLGRHLPEAIVR